MSKKIKIAYETKGSFSKFSSGKASVELIDFSSLEFYSASFNPSVLRHCHAFISGNGRGVITSRNALGFVSTDHCSNGPPQHPSIADSCRRRSRPDGKQNTNKDDDEW